MILPARASSWTYALDQERINSTQTAIGVAAAQLQWILTSLPATRWEQRIVGKLFGLFAGDGGGGL